MKLEHSFQVNAPLERVWQALVDVERVAPCLPGAEITDADESGTYRGTFTVRLGPTTAAYRGELAMEEVDDAAHRAVMRANGADKRGQGSAKARIMSTMREEGDLTTVDVETDFTITGRLARFGRGGMIQDVSNRLLRDFSECLQQTIEQTEPTAEPATGEYGPVGAQPAPVTGEGPSPAAPPAPEGAKPVSGLSLFVGALIDRLKRLFKRR